MLIKKLIWEIFQKKLYTHFIFVLFFLDGHFILHYKTPCSVTSGDSKGFKQLGYCPQFDALNMKLTTKENMIFFARIRGIPNKDIESVGYFP